MAQPFKPAFNICPVCGQRLALNMTVCGRCHTPYQVKPVATPVPSAPVPHVQIQPMPASLTAQAPKDDVEWKVSAFWYWFGLYVCLSVAVFSLWMFLHVLDILPGGHWYWVLYIALACFGASFCILRLRRLYVYFSHEARPWHWSAITIAVLIIFPLVYKEYEFQQARRDSQERETASAQAMQSQRDAEQIRQSQQRTQQEVQQRYPYRQGSF